jgi:hypothetical protein
MNALQDIQNAAQIIVEQLADRQVNQIKQLQAQFNEWNGRPSINSDRVYEYVYRTYIKKWNQVTGKYEPVTEVPGEWDIYKTISKDKVYKSICNDIMLQYREWETPFKSLFISQNLIKLNRALAKHLNQQQTATNIKVTVGGDGAEVEADVDGKRFVGFGVLCGGDVQRLHYRYRSSLK